MIRPGIAIFLQCVFCIASVSADEMPTEDFTTQMMRATVKVNHEKSTGTGFILRKGERFILVTAAHVLMQTPGPETTVIFRRLQAEGEYTKEPLKITIRKDKNPLWLQHPQSDVAVIELTPPKEIDLAPVGVEHLATDEMLKKQNVHPGDQLTCLGYPHREESSAAGFPILRDGPIASFPLTPTAKTKTFYMSMNVFEGDSGGPVFLVRPARSKTEPEARLIVGLISGQRFLDEEARMIYGTIKLRQRLGLAIVAHASFIRDTVDRIK